MIKTHVWLDHFKEKQYYHEHVQVPNMEVLS